MEVIISRLPLLQSKHAVIKLSILFLPPLHMGIYIYSKGTLGGFAEQY